MPLMCCFRRQPCCGGETYEIPEVLELDFSHCSLTEVPGDVFTYERTLEKLNLDSNQISDLPPSLFFCHELRELNISDNDLTCVPSAIASLTRLSSLNLSRNAISEIADNIKHLKSLKTLDLSMNHLGKLPDAVSQLLNLEELFLSDTFLEYLMANFGRLTKLKVLELRENSVQSLPKSMNRLNHLQRLDIGQNDFSELPEVIGTMIGLVELWCDNNAIRVLPKFMGNLSKLSCIDFSNNELEEIHEDIGKCVSLTDVTLNYNSINRIPDTILKLGNLTILRLDRNQLQSLPEGFGSLNSLEELSAIENNLQSIPSSIGLLRKLHAINLDNNLLTELPKEIGSCHSLAIISIAKNRLSTLPSEMGYLNNLRVMNLSGNYLLNLPVSLISLPNLRALWLSETQSKPMLPMNQELDPTTNQRVLTCYLLPQAKLYAEKAFSNEGEAGRNRSQRSIKFESDAENEKIENPMSKRGLLRAPTPYPKELRALAKHASNIRQSRELNGDIGNLQASSEPLYDGEMFPDNQIKEEIGLPSHAIPRNMPPEVVSAPAPVKEKDPRVKEVVDRKGESVPFSDSTDGRSVEMITPKASPKPHIPENSFVSVEEGELKAYEHNNVSNMARKSPPPYHVAARRAAFFRSSGGAGGAVMGSPKNSNVEAILPNSLPMRQFPVTTSDQLKEQLTEISHLKLEIEKSIQKFHSDDNGSGDVLTNYEGAELDHLPDEMKISELDGDTLDCGHHSIDASQLDADPSTMIRTTDIADYAEMSQKVLHVRQEEQSLHEDLRIENKAYAPKSVENEIKRANEAFLSNKFISPSPSKESNVNGHYYAMEDTCNIPKSFQSPRSKPSKLPGPVLSNEKKISSQAMDDQRAKSSLKHTDSGSFNSKIPKLPGSSHVSSESSEITPTKKDKPNVNLSSRSRIPGLVSPTKGSVSSVSSHLASSYVVQAPEEARATTPQYSSSNITNQVQVKHDSPRTEGASRIPKLNDSFRRSNSTEKKTSMHPKMSPNDINAYGSAKKPWIFGFHKNARVVPLEYQKLGTELGFCIEDMPSPGGIEGNGVHVVSVEQDSTVKIGDKLLQVDGIDVSNMGVEIVRKILNNCQSMINLLVSRRY